MCILSTSLGTVNSRRVVVDLHLFLVRAGEEHAVYLVARRPWHVEVLSFKRLP